MLARSISQPVLSRGVALGAVALHNVVVFPDDYNWYEEFFSTNGAQSKGHSITGHLSSRRLDIFSMNRAISIYQRK